MTKPTAFQRVSQLNVGFSNPKGDPDNIDWDKVRSQCKNIFDEYLELLVGLGLDPWTAASLAEWHAMCTKTGRFSEPPQLRGVRDALCDIQVFDLGAQHFLGADGDADMEDVIDGLFSRFIKDDADKAATIAKHAAKGVTQVYFEGEYPLMVMKSAVDQPDAPKGKVMKSASFKDTVFRPLPASAEARLYGGARGGSMPALVWPEPGSDL